MRLKTAFAVAMTVGAIAIELPALEIVNVGSQQMNSLTGTIPEGSLNTMGLGGGLALGGIGLFIGGVRRCGARFRR